jgi:hypothetical protein
MRIESSQWRHDTEHNDTERNDAQHNDAQHNDAQHNDAQHKRLICDAQHKGHSTLYRSVIIAACCFADSQALSITNWGYPVLP